MSLAAEIDAVPIEHVEGAEGMADAYPDHYLIAGQELRRVQRVLVELAALEAGRRATMQESLEAWSDVVRVVEETGR